MGTIVAALLAGLASVAFVLAPVTEHRTSYHWSSSPSQPHGILQLSPYRPASLAVSLDCDRVLAAAKGKPRVLLSTVYAARGHRADGSSQGGSWRLTKLAMRVQVAQGRVAMTSGGGTLGRVGLPQLRACSILRIDVGPDESQVWADDELLRRTKGDLRPAVTGLFADAAAGNVVIDVQTDSQFDTSPTMIKISVAVIALLALAAALNGTRRLDRAYARPWALHPPRLRRRMDFMDGLVLLIMLVWVEIGAGTDDDGFIKQIVGNRDAVGYFGNYVRWNNTPEAPFGWFYEAFQLWSRVSWEPVWMRVLPLILGLLGWVVTRHLLLPRLCVRCDRRVVIVTAGGFLPCWMLYANSLRPEIWFALGLALSLLLVDVGRTSHGALPICIATVVAGLTAGVGPTGLVAFAPILAALPSMIKIFGRRRLSAALATMMTALAGAGISLLLMFRDQTLASVLSSYRARTAFGPDYHWYDDARRYVDVLDSTLPRTLTVLVPFVIAAFVAVALLRCRRLEGTRTSLARLLLGTFALYFPILMFSPTKLYHHFGGLLLLTPLLCALTVRALSRRDGASPGLVAGLVLAMSAAVGVCLTRPNAWWELANVGIWSGEEAIRVGSVGLSTPMLVLGIVLAVVIIFIGYRTGRAAGISVLGRNLLISGLAFWVVFPLVCFGEAFVSRRGQYTIGAANWAALTGDGCLLERGLQVEPRPSAGVLTSPTEEVDFPRIGLGGLPVRSIAPGQRIISGWYAIPAGGTRTRPLVVRVKGIEEGDRIRAEFDHGPPLSVSARRPTAGGDVRLPIGQRPDAGRLRLVISRGSAADGDLIVSAPRVPRTISLRELAGDDPVAIDWRVSFFTPCLTPARLGDGRVQLPGYAFGHDPVDQLVGSHYRGGPLGGVPDVARFVRLPLYPAGEDRASMITSLQLFRVVPVAPAAQVERRDEDVVRWGWETTPNSGR